MSAGVRTPFLRVMLFRQLNCEGGLAANHHAAGSVIANLNQIDTGVGHGNDFGVGSVGALSNETSDGVEDANGLLFGTTDDDVVVGTVDGDVVAVHVVNTDVLCEEAGDFGGGFGDDKGYSLGQCVVVRAETFPVIEVEACIGNGMEDDGVADEAFVVV